MTSPRTSGRQVSVWPLALPIVFWAVIFHFKPLPFWDMMTPAVAIMGAVAVAMSGKGIIAPAPLVREIGKGVASAALLYGVFFIGNFVAAHIIPGATADIGAVYGIRAGTSLVLVSLALLLVIGPGEVLFWQGLVERRWIERFGAARGWLFTSLVYAGIHLWSGNPMLVLAALVAGLAWGGLYARGWSVQSLIVSHALWDVGILILFPIR